MIGLLANLKHVPVAGKNNIPLKTITEKNIIKQVNKIMATENIFNSLANQFKNKSESEILSMAMDLRREFVIVISQATNSNVILKSLLLAAAIGVEGKQLNDKEKRLVDVFFNDICTNMESIYDVITEPLTEENWERIKVLSTVGVAAGMPFLKLILCFAYVDGFLSDEIAEKLEQVFGLILSAAYLMGDME